MESCGICSKDPPTRGVTSGLQFPCLLGRRSPNGMGVANGLPRYGKARKIHYTADTHLCSVEQTRKKGLRCLKDSVFCQIRIRWRSDGGSMCDLDGELMTNCIWHRPIWPIHDHENTFRTIPTFVTHHSTPYFWAQASPTLQLSSFCKKEHLNTSGLHHPCRFAPVSTVHQLATHGYYAWLLYYTRGCA